MPELAHLPDADIHDPPAAKRGDYPQPVIGHREARARALESYRAARAGRED